MVEASLQVNKTKGETMQKLILLLAVLIPATTIAQEVDKPIRPGVVVDISHPEARGIFMEDEQGNTIGMMIPTPQFALDALQAEKDPLGHTAARILRQVYWPYASAELDAFADELKRLAIESPSTSVSQAALDALMIAGWLDEGNTYERGLDLLIEIYEAIDYETLINGPQIVEPRDLLWRIFGASTKGEAYLMDRFESLDQPEKACWVPPYSYASDRRSEFPPKEEWCPYVFTEWCEVGELLGKEGKVDLPFIYSICDGRMVKVQGFWQPIQHQPLPPRQQ